MPAEPTNAPTADSGASPMDTTGDDYSNKRTSLNGCWILDKTRENWSMRGYLEAMNVNELAIAAHEKGETEHDTYHTITLDQKNVKIVKRSRVNADLMVQMELGKETMEFLPPGNRPKYTEANSNGPGHLEIKSSLHTVNGVAEVTDVKVFQPHVDSDSSKCEMIQTLTILNKQTGQTNTTVRHFLPYTKTPPHLEEEEAS